MRRSGNSPLRAQVFRLSKNSRALVLLDPGLVDAGGNGATIAHATCMDLVLVDEAGASHR